MCVGPVLGIRMYDPISLGVITRRVERELNKLNKIRELLARWLCELGSG